jgi:hypothetical protein
MSPQQASRLAAYGRRLLTAKLLTPHDYAVMDALLWRLRRPGRWDTAAPYNTIARLAGVSRDTAIGAIHKLVTLGIVARKQRRVLVRWGRNRAEIASRQIANLYVFNALSTESATPPATRGLEIQSTVSVDKSVDNSLLDKALTLLGRTIGVPIPI